MAVHSDFHPICKPFVCIVLHILRNLFFYSFPFLMERK